MKIRLEGSEKECNRWADNIDRCFLVKSISKFYPNKGNKKEGRIYIKAETIKDMPDYMSWAVIVTDKHVDLCEVAEWDNILQFIDNVKEYKDKKGEDGETIEGIYIYKTFAAADKRAAYESALLDDLDKKKKGSHK